MVRPFLPRTKAQLSAQLYNACRNGKWDQADALLRRGADPNVTSNSSQTSSLSVAVQKKSLRACKPFHVHFFLLWFALSCLAPRPNCRHSCIMHVAMGSGIKLMLFYDAELIRTSPVTVAK